MNAHTRTLHGADVIEAWAGGPCITTGQYCPVWSVRRADGTGTQQRGLSSGPDVRGRSEGEREAAQRDAAAQGLRAALAWVSS